MTWGEYLQWTPMTIMVVNMLVDIKDRHSSRGLVYLLCPTQNGLIQANSESQTSEYLLDCKFFRNYLECSHLTCSEHFIVIFFYVEFHDF